MLYIFDMGGVVTSTAVIDDNFCSRVGMPLWDFEKFYGKGTSENLFQMCSNGIIDTKEFWKRISERSGIKITTDWFHWMFHPVLNEKTVELIKYLKSQGHRVVCGTNTISAHYFSHLERGDYSFFDQTYSSCAMGVSKPDTGFWKLILEAEGFEPDNTVFFDDKKENCEAARSMGITAVEFTTTEEAARKIGIELWKN